MDVFPQKILKRLSLMMLLIVVVAITSQVGRQSFGFLGYTLSLFSDLIYLGLFMAWGLSVRKRVLHKACNRYLFAIAMLCLFWFLLRMLKYRVDVEEIYLIYAWYAFYIPMIIIPWLGLMITTCLWKFEKKQPPLAYRLLVVPALLLLAMVFSNNWHRWVFKDPFSLDYEHSWGYFVIVAWIVGLMAWSMVRLLGAGKSQPSKNKLLLFIPLFLGILYTWLYVKNVPGVRATDMTAILCLLNIAIWEVTIQIGLIPSNIGYLELFKHCTMEAKITDQLFQVKYASLKSRDLPVSLLKMAVHKPVVLAGGNHLLHANALAGGYVFWIEDLSHLKKVRQILEESYEQLNESKNLLELELILEDKKMHLAEKSQLYDGITSEVLPKLEEVMRKLQSPIAPNQYEKTIYHICFTTAYIKRRLNLRILAETSMDMAIQELTYALRESCDYLGLYGVPHALQVDGEGVISAKQTLAAYDAFQLVVEKFMPTLQALLLNLSVEEEALHLIFSLSLKSFAMDDLPQEAIQALGGDCNWTLYEQDGRLAIVFRKEGEHALLPST